MREWVNRSYLAFTVLVFGTAVWADPPPAPTPPVPPAPPLAPTNTLGPIIQFQVRTHDFGKAKSGEPVKYTYIFTNGGDQVLEIGGVQACGCITADYSKKVEPGQTGSIPISFNSAGYGGQLTKTITVTCNDRTNPRPQLQLTGVVWRPVDINPQFAVLNLNADSPMGSATIALTNNLPDPITLSPPECNNPAFTAELKTNQPGRDFRLVITPSKPLATGSAQAQVNIKTSSTNMPVITVNVFASMQPAMTINPPQLSLPPAPLAQAQTNVVTFNNNSTNPMVLSEPVVSAPGVQVLLKENMSGRNYAATLAFPQGFGLGVGVPAELTLKSSLSAMPLIKVPILQMPPPAYPRALAPPVPPRAPIAPKPPTVRTNRNRPLPPIDLPPLPP